VALTRADYLEHFRNALGRVLTLNPEIISLLQAGLADYVTNGTRGTLADRREAIRIIRTYGREAAMSPGRLLA
jgi:hypothetical protein